MCVVRHNSWRAGFDTIQNFGSCLRARFSTEISFAVDADADSVGVHVAFSDHKHANPHLFGALDFAVDLVGAVVNLRGDLMTAQLLESLSGARFVTIPQTLGKSFLRSRADRRRKFSRSNHRTCRSGFWHDTALG